MIKRVSRPAFARNKQRRRRAHTHAFTAVFANRLVNRERPVEVNGLNRANRLAGFTDNAFSTVPAGFGERLPGFRVMAPPAPQRTTLEKHRRP
jgi:hypothetical protein